MSNVKELTPRQESRRHRILLVAREMVADHGYEGMVMSEVAERADVSPTTLYNLYNTKDELLLEEEELPLFLFFLSFFIFMGFIFPSLPIFIGGPPPIIGGCYGMPPICCGG